jgi:hypothetical protein
MFHKNRDFCMDRELSKMEQNLVLAATYIKINEKGRVILDMVIQELGKIHWPQKIDTKRDKCLKKYGKAAKEVI